MQDCDTNISETFNSDTSLPDSILDMLAWALASGSQDRAWWAGQLGLDEAALDALLEHEGQRLLRARLLSAVGRTTGSRDVAQALRARVLELSAGQPKAATVAQLALALKRLPGWIVHEWDDRVPLLPAGMQLKAVQFAKRQPDAIDDEAVELLLSRLPDLPDLRAAIAEAKQLMGFCEREQAELQARMG